MINQEKLKIVLDLYKEGHIDFEKAYVLLQGAEQPTIQPAPINPWVNPWIPPIITFQPTIQQ